MVQSSTFSDNHGKKRVKCFYVFRRNHFPRTDDLIVGNIQQSRYFLFSPEYRLRIRKIPRESYLPIKLSVLLIPCGISSSTRRAFSSIPLILMPCSRPYEACDRDAIFDNQGTMVFQQETTRSANQATPPRGVFSFTRRRSSKLPPKR